MLSRLPENPPDAGVVHPLSAHPASSALSMRARAFSASLEPVTPPLRNARRDTGFPAAASLRAITWVRSTCGCAGRCPAPVIPLPCCGPGLGPFWSCRADRSRSDTVLRSGPSWSC